MVWGQVCQTVIAVVTRERNEQHVILQILPAHSSFNGNFFFFLDSLTTCLLNVYALNQEMILS